MEIILKKDIDNLGSKDEMVKVRDGYARNYLIPNGLASIATVSAKKMHAETLKQRAHKEAKVKEEATKMAKKLQDLVVKVGAKVGDNGKIFGSVSTIQVAESLKALGFDIERKNITIKDEPIKHTGKYEADAKLHKEVSVTFTFEVQGE